MNLQELLSQADLKDDLEFELNGNKFKVGDLKGFRSGVESERTALLNQKKEAEKLAKEAQDLLGALDTAMKEVQKQQAPTKKEEKADWRKNPLYEELLPVVDALETQTKQALGLAGDLKKSLDQSQAIYAAERLRREWAEAQDKPKEAKFEDVVKEVLGRGDKDSFGMPSLSRWLHDAGEGTRIQRAVDEALKKSNADWEQKVRMGAVQKPGSSTKFSTQKAGAPPIKNLSELTSEVVAADPDVAAAMAGEVS